MDEEAAVEGMANAAAGVEHRSYDNENCLQLNMQRLQCYIGTLSRRVGSSDPRTEVRCMGITSDSRHSHQIW